MDLYDFPRFSEDLSPEGASSVFDSMRENLPDKWMNEEAYKTDINSFAISPDHSRYTVSVDEVPFECLYLPDNTDRLYIMLSAGGTTSRRYPSFMRWKYKSYLKGHVVCIDDPMYHFHKGLSHVMWYYGTKDKSYLELLIRLIGNIASQLSIPPENVTIVGSSGGGYAALYCGNRIDHCSVIAINPQFYPKNWTSTATIKSFKDWGIDLSDPNEKFGRNGIVLDNNTSYFMVITNMCSEQDYVHQLGEYAKGKNFDLKYGISQHGNFLTWIHNTPYKVPHWVIPEKLSIVTMDQILRKCKKGYNANELINISSLFNEILVDRYAAKTQLEEKAKASDKADSLITKLINSRIKKIFPDHLPENFTAWLNGDDEVMVKRFSPANVFYYIGSQRSIRYQLVSSVEEVYFCLLVKDAYSFMPEGKLEDYLENAGIKYRFGKNDLICSVVLDPENLNECIDTLLSNSMKLIGQFDFSD